MQLSQNSNALKPATIITLRGKDVASGKSAFARLRQYTGARDKLVTAARDLIVRRPLGRLPRGAEFDLAGRDVIAVQSKHRRLGMTVAGQTLFSKELLKRFKPRSIRSVAVCTADDAVLRPLLERHKGCEVWVYPVRHAGRK